MTCSDALKALVSGMTVSLAPLPATLRVAPPAGR